MKRPPGVWVIIAYAALIFILGVLDIKDVIFGTLNPILNGLPESVVLATQVPTVTAAAALATLAFKKSRHAIWGCIALMVTMLLPIVVLFLPSQRVYLDSYHFVPDISFGAVMLVWICIYLYQQRRSGLYT